MPDLLPAYPDQKEHGMGLVDALVSMALILIASIALFGGLAYFAQTNTASEMNLNSVQSAMESWTSTPTSAASPTASTQSYSLNINVHYVAATSGTQSVSTPVAFAESGNGYGWTKVATQ